MTEDNPNLYREPFKRILREEGKRSSPDSVDMMKEEVELYSYRIARRAAELAEHADRKTVKPSDMEKAIRQLKEEN